MTTTWASSLFLSLLFGTCVCCAEEKTPSKLILKVDEAVSGPFGGQTSASCLRVYSDGRVVYASRWNSAFSVVDAAGQESRPEHKVSVEHHLEEGDAFELSAFFESKALKRLSDKFAPPHPPIDYFETTSVQIMLPRGRSKQISTREFYVADMEEKTRYPAALIVLMDKIDEIEKQAADKGKPIESPPDCRLNPANPT
jgi:hypothetical protein